MKDHSLISKLFICGVHNLSRPEELLSFLRDYPVSGVALFNAPRDSDDYIWSNEEAGKEILYEFLSKIQNHVSFICVDQEGGRVQRLRGPFIKLPSAAEIANAGPRPDQLHELYRLVAQQLVNTGIKLNFAPVCDIQHGSTNSAVVGDRAFSDNKNVVIQMTKQVCEAFESQGLHSTLKHYPGHGSSDFDSHDQLAVFSRPMSEVLAEDAEVFREVATFSSAIMPGHFASMEDPETVFTMDPDWLAQAKQSMPTHIKWITDDMATMKAVSEMKPWIKYFDAGYDFLLLCKSLDHSANAIEETIKHSESKELSTQSELELEMKCKHSQESFTSNTQISDFNSWNQDLLEAKAKAEALLNELRL